MELENQAREPDSIEGLGHLEKDIPAASSCHKGGGNRVHNEKALIDCGMVKPETVLVLWDVIFLIKSRKDMFKEEFFKH